MGFWEEVAAQRDVDMEHREAMIRLLPNSYPYYTRYLFEKEDYQTWIDLCMFMNVSPMNIDSSLLKLVERADVSVLLPLYHRAAELHIQARNRADYKAAVKLLKKLEAVYKKQKMTARFDSYLEGITRRYSRHRAFQEELRKGKLIV